MRSQENEILLRLIKGQKLTPLDGLRMTNKTMDFRKRISHLREKYAIDSQWINLPNGKKVKQHYMTDEQRLSAIQKLKQQTK